MSFAAIIPCVASQREIPNVSVYFVMTQSGNFWIHPRKKLRSPDSTLLNRHGYRDRQLYELWLCIRTWTWNLAKSIFTLNTGTNGLLVFAQIV